MDELMGDWSEDGEEENYVDKSIEQEGATVKKPVLNIPTHNTASPPSTAASSKASKRAKSAATSATKAPASTLTASDQNPAHGRIGMGVVPVVSQVFSPAVSSGLK